MGIFACKSPGAVINAMDTRNKTLVIAVDNSEECLKAINFAKEYFPTGYTYHLLHIQTRPFDTAAAFVGNADATDFAYDTPKAWEEDRIAASEEFLNRIFIPKASEGGATVTATLLHSESDGSNAIGAAICDFMDKHKPAAVLLMKQNKSAVCRLFVGSVTKYCASHCHAPVIIVPV